MANKIGREFMKKTTYAFMEDSWQEQGRPQPALEQVYEGTEFVELPTSFSSGERSFVELVNNRRSVRKYSQESLTLEELAYLLWCTQGVKEVKQDKATLRTVPSAGARHAFETLLAVNNVEGLTKGLYAYQATKHRLVRVMDDSEIMGKVEEGCLSQPFISKSAVTFLWVAVTERMYWRYGERGYRYLHLDAGHVCQNLYLAAESIGCGACAIAAYDDEKINRTLKLDGEEQFVIYVATIGKQG